MPEPPVTLLYRHPQTGEEVSWEMPVPCSPLLQRLIETALTKKGFVRVEEPE